MDRRETSVPALPPTRNDPAYLAAKGCDENDLLEIATDQPAYPVPAVQQMPTQEPSSARVS
jgi:hypothetical protein